MTPEKQRIAIAEACGWQGIRVELEYDASRHPVGYLVHPEFPHSLPDYLNDLNAMHEAEKTLTLMQEESYWAHLLYIAGVARAYRATAAQRAEAFLKITGKWEEDA